MVSVLLVVRNAFDTVALSSLSKNFASLKFFQFLNMLEWLPIKIRMVEADPLIENDLAWKSDLKCDRIRRICLTRITRFSYVFQEVLVSLVIFCGVALLNRFSKFSVLGCLMCLCKRSSWADENTM